MTARRAEQEIDRLYQLPLDEFVAARNALARRLGGPDARRVKALVRPTLPAWAANQLYWQARTTYDALVTAADRMRSAHRAAIAGRTADLRAADAAHRRALAQALREALALLETAGYRATASTTDTIARTLEALPDDQHPGRLARPLQPSGFQALAGVRLPTRPRERTRQARTLTARSPVELKRRKGNRAVLRQAERAARTARAAIRRETAHVSAATKRLERARGQEARVQQSLARAQTSVREAERALTAAQQRVNDAKALAAEAEERLREAGLAKTDPA